MKTAWLIVAATVFGSTAVLAQSPGKGPGWAFNADNTRGWSMMSRQERREHRGKMLSMKTCEECVAYLAQDMCERMRHAGRIS